MERKEKIVSLVSFTPIQDGVTGVNAAATNTPLSTIYNDYNGNITDANISSSAAIAGSKISYSTVSNPYKFSVYLSTNQTVTSSTWSQAAFDTKIFDTNSNFNTSTHQFTATISGFYQFNITLPAISVPSGDAYQIALNVGTFSVTPTLVGFTNYIGGTGNPIASMSALVQLSAAQTVQVYGYTSSTTLGGGINFSNFSGFLVSAT